MRRQADREADIRKAMAMLNRAANSNRPFPSNTQIADSLGMLSRSGAHKLLAEMERRGLVEINRAGGKRALSIVGRPQTKIRPFEAPQPIIRIDSRPCFNCGASGYVGCEHFPREAIAA